MKATSEVQMMTDSPPRPRRRWLRFSLRFLLLLVAVLAIPLSWKVNCVRNQRAVVAELMRLNGLVGYHHQLRSVRVARRTAEPPGPKWLTAFLGDDFFAEVILVSVGGEQVTDKTIYQVASLPHLNTLSISSNSISDAGVKSLARHSGLDSLTVTSAKVTEQGLMQLTGLKGLKHLSLGLFSVGDSELESITVLKQLESLDLHGMPAISDKTLDRLPKLNNLRHLSLRDVPITDVGLLHLYGMSKLESLRLVQTQASLEGMIERHNALPNCKIHTNP